jgi:hypothetical protein
VKKIEQFLLQFSYKIELQSNLTDFETNEATFVQSYFSSSSQSYNDFSNQSHQTQEIRNHFPHQFYQNSDIIIQSNLKVFIEKFLKIFNIDQKVIIFRMDLV